MSQQRISKQFIQSIPDALLFKILPFDPTNQSGTWSDGLPSLCLVVDQEITSTGKSLRASHPAIAKKGGSSLYRSELNISIGLLMIFSEADSKPHIQENT